MAEGLFRHIARQCGVLNMFTVDSAGLTSWHIGHPPDDRARMALLRRGVEISELRARRVVASDFEKFDLILAMDRSIRQSLLKMAPAEHEAKVGLFLDYAPNLCVREIPDPFFGEEDGFDYVCQLIDTACRGLILSLTAKQQSRTYAAPTSCPAASVSG